MRGWNESVSLRMMTYPNIVFASHCHFEHFFLHISSSTGKTNPKTGKLCEIVAATVLIFLKMCTSSNIIQIN